jgi:hypothetical protein
LIQIAGEGDGRSLRDFAQVVDDAAASAKGLPKRAHDLVASDGIELRRASARQQGKSVFKGFD